MMCIFFFFFFLLSLVCFASAFSFAFALFIQLSDLCLGAVIFELTAAQEASTELHRDKQFFRDNRYKLIRIFVKKINVVEIVTSRFPVLGLPFL